MKKLKEKFSKDKQIYLEIRIAPSSSQNEIKEVGEGAKLKINIKAPAEKGKANKELVKLLSKEFSVTRENVIIISGAGSRDKIIKILK